MSEVHLEGAVGASEFRVWKELCGLVCVNRARECSSVEEAV